MFTGMRDLVYDRFFQGHVITPSVSCPMEREVVQSRAFRPILICNIAFLHSNSAFRCF